MGDVHPTGMRPRLKWNCGWGFSVAFQGLQLEQSPPAPKTEGPSGGKSVGTSLRSIVVIGIAMLLVSAFPDVPAQAGSCWNYKPAERRMAKKINGARDATGDNRLRLDPQLSRVARAHTNGMVKRRTLYHTPSAALGRRVTRWRSLGENVGVAGGVRRLHRIFMNSPAHRANNLAGSFRFVGIGTKRSRGRVWVTVVFESRRNPGTRLRMPSC